jgi:hypothetical protein
MKVRTVHVFVLSERRSKCASKRKFASLPVTYFRGYEEEDEEEEEYECCENEFACVADEECADLFHRILNLELGPLVGDVFEEFGYLRFEKGVLELGPWDIYLLCDYETIDDGTCDDKGW